ncbi:MAG: translation elongation factor 4 [Patescibacteria group bacterium]
MSENIRNFCIIAHIDHGKSTLADRFLDITHQIPERKMREQYLDQMDLERERGITIKLQPVKLNYKDFELNLIDTPGHVDFTYEVSRSLAAVEGAVLLVDATQGIQAQTLGNLYLALEHNLTIIPVVNKIDLPNAEVERTAKELSQLLGVPPDTILRISAKRGDNIAPILDRIIKDVPAPKGEREGAFQALIFDSQYDEYRGVVAFIRVMSGEVRASTHVKFFASQKVTEVLEVGSFSPELKKGERLVVGQIGYLASGLKELNLVRVGDTVMKEGVDTPPLPGYKEVKPMVYASLYSSTGEGYEKLREALEKLKLNDAALTFVPEHSPALGFGFRGGFLGLLHLEIVQERLAREYNLPVVTTVPSVAYKVFLLNREEATTIHSAEEWPNPSLIKRAEEPFVKLDIVTSKEYIGQIFSLLNDFCGLYKATEYLDFSENSRLILHYEMPLASILVDFYDKLKSASSGFASLNYELLDYRPVDLVKLDILVAEERVPALASLVYRSKAYAEGRRVVDTLKEILPKQQFVVKIQAALGGQIIAASHLRALRKDVTAKLYGGDVTRKRKLLEKQKKGKKKMLERGSVEIPAQVYLKLLKR